jgi:hypothetical protein
MHLLVPSNSSPSNIRGFEGPAYRSMQPQGLDWIVVQVAEPVEVSVRVMKVAVMVVKQEENFGQT